MNIINKMSEVIVTHLKNFTTDFTKKLTHLSSETIHWIAVLCFHAATVPSLVALMLGITDKTPPIDFVLIVWAGLGLLFMKAIIMKDRLNLITIGLGFMAQAVVIALVFFK